MGGKASTGEYGPGLVALMGEALESAWARAQPAKGDAELGRLVMASAILDKVDAGARELEFLIQAAISAWKIAGRLSGGENDESGFR